MADHCNHGFMFPCRKAAIYVINNKFYCGEHALQRIPRFMIPIHAVSAKYTGECENEEKYMAHTLLFLENKHGTNVVDITEHSLQKRTYVVVYKDNLTVIVDSIDSDPTGTDMRRVYKVREWVRVNECRATRME